MYRAAIVEIPDQRHEASVKLFDTKTPAVGAPTSYARWSNSHPSGESKSDQVVQQATCQGSVAFEAVLPDPRREGGFTNFAISRCGTTYEDPVVAVHTADGT